MQDYARDFYLSKQWRDLADAYRRNHPLCERCLANGSVEPSRLVHHKIPITPENIDDLSVTLNQDNLEAICYTCHSVEHGYTKSACREGFAFDDEGNFIHQVLCDAPISSGRVSQKRTGGVDAHHNE